MQRESLKKAAIIFLVSLVVVLGAGYAMANHYFKQLILERTDINHSIIEQPNNGDNQTGDGNNDSVSPVPKEDNKPRIKTILLAGTDRSGYRTDSMMAIRIDLSSKRISLFSIPRDYRIELTKDVQKSIKHYANYIKLTELHAFAKMADQDSPISFTAKAIEELTGLKFDHIVVFKIKAFRKVVDAVGGVKVYVPKNMDYDDPHQKLHIHLKRGYHLLDGKQAEELVRFRKNNNGSGYGDFGRMEMQQYFLKEFVKKLVSLESALNFNEIFDAIKDFVQTDITLSQALMLLSEVKDIDLSNVYSHTLPGEDKWIKGGYYYNPPKISELHDFVDEQVAIDVKPQVTSKDSEIIMLNGTGKGKMAAKFKQKMEDAGYNIVSIGDYHGERKLKTRIIVKSEAEGQDLKQFFNLSEIIVDAEIENTTIVLGQIEE